MRFIKTNTPKIILVLCCLLTVLACKKDEKPVDDTTDDMPATGILDDVAYIKTFGGGDEDEALSIVESNDGNYLILGSTKSTDGDIEDKAADDVDFWLLKINPAGEKIWSKTYGGSSDDRATKISKTSDGGYMLSGYSRSSDGDVSGNEGFHDMWIAKLDSQGNIQWDKNFGFSGSDQAYDAFQTTDGGYFVTGFLDVTASGGAGDDAQNDPGNDDSARENLHGVGEFWGIKLNANGVKQWRRYFGGTSNDRSYDALQTNDGGFLMIGASESTDFDIIDDKGSYDLWAVRLSPNGDLIWTRSFGGIEIDIGYGATKANDGNYIMIGDTRSMDQDVSNPLGNADCWAVKFNDDGDIIWERTYGGTEFESGRNIIPLSSGNYLISGSTRSPNGDVTENRGQNDIWAIIIDPAGAIIEQKTFGGTSLDFADAAIETSDNKIVIVGNTESNDLDIPQNKGIKDFVVIKFN